MTALALLTPSLYRVLHGHTVNTSHPDPHHTLPYPHTVHQPPYAALPLTARWPALVQLPPRASGHCGGRRDGREDNADWLLLMPPWTLVLTAFVMTQRALASLY